MVRFPVGCYKGNKNKLKIYFQMGSRHWINNKDFVTICSFEENIFQF